ncbi:MAG: hypothetical protein FWB98_02100 [Defluviitaleaceae bacterium]|nr:hypothetical protein [Defluviitaleaceae bacterium]
MLESQFEKYLIGDANITSKTKAVNSRMSKARAVEEYLSESLDVIVQDDMKMYDALRRIKQNMNDGNGSYSNSLRKYYSFKNKHEFPRIVDFERKNGL